MVKVSSGRENVECSFGEDVDVVSVLGRKDDIIFLGSNSKFGGQGGLLNVFIVE